MRRAAAKSSIETEIESAFLFCRDGGYRITIAHRPLVGPFAAKETVVMVDKTEDGLRTGWADRVHAEEGGTAIMDAFLGCVRELRKEAGRGRKRKE